MKYYLPLHIGRLRYHIVTLLPTTQNSPSNTPLPQFILTQEGGLTHFFSIEHQHYLVAHSGMIDDLSWSSIKAEFDAQENRLKLYIKTSKLDEKIQRGGQFLTPLKDAPITTTANIGMQQIDVGLNAGLEGSFIVEILLGTSDNITHKGSFILHIAPSNYIWNIALDFGSEASQLAIYRPNDGTAVSILPVISYLKTFYKELATEKDDTKFIQYDANDLFRSIFFAANDGTLETVDTPNTPNELIAMLTLWKDFDKNVKLLPTVKLSTLGLQSQLMLKVRGTEQNFGQIAKRVHRKLIFNFLHTACKTIQTDKERFIRFKLLIPNVFNQSQVSDLVEKVERDAAAFVQAHPQYRLKAIEINTISESDAAFAGYLLNLQSPLRTNGKYVIIDAGRGTTDYSVVQMPSTNTAVGLYRSGFVGAGALLTFSFIDTLMTSILKLHHPNFTAYQRQLFFKEVIYNADAKWQAEFLQIAEMFKKRYSAGIIINTPLIEKDKIKDLFKIELETLNKHLNENWLNATNYYMGDTFKFIENTTTALANQIYNEISKIPSVILDINKVDGIILSGRGFLFKPLVERLKERFGTDKVASVQNLKSVCIQGAFSNHQFNGNCNMIGIPYAARTLAGGKQTIQTDKPTAVQPKKARWWEIARDWFVQEDAPREKKEEYYRNIDLFLKGGSVTEYNTDSETIYVSGQVYAHQLPRTQGNVNLFFTGTNFIIRSQTHCAELIPSATLGIDRNSPFISKTLFPASRDLNVPVDPVQDTNQPL